MSYEKIHTLGSGGFGTVILARETLSQRLVAIKKLRIEDIQQQDEIIRETMILARFSHPNIVTYYHAFKESGLVNLVMEYCPMGSLLGRINNKPLPILEALTTTINIAKAMEVVHGEGIIHHDIKPANLLLDNENNIKICDFGIANKGGGTVGYLAPEYYSDANHDIDRVKLDVYALGTTFLEMLLGEYPFNAFKKEEILDNDVQRQFLNGFPNWLKDIVIRSIHPDPEKRYASMKVFYQQLEQRNIPNLITKKVIETGKVADEIERLIKRKKWGEAEGKIRYGITNMTTHPKLLYQAGRFFMKKNNLPKAKSFFEVIKKKSTIINIDKELGWILLQENKFSDAISCFSDYIQLNPIDQEAYNLLLECYYRSVQYEIGFELAEIFRKNFPKQLCFMLNAALFAMLMKKELKEELSYYSEIKNNALLFYNESVFTEKHPTWDPKGIPKLESKLLFCDYSFTNNAKINNRLEISLNDEIIDTHTGPIITLGREGYTCNDIQLEGSNISRRHCLIFNSLNNVWLFDLDSYLGTFVEGAKIQNKIMIYGKTNIKIGNNLLTVNSDNRMLV